MDKALIAHKFSKSLASYNQEAKAQKMIISKLMEMFSYQDVQYFDKILEFGTGTGLLTQRIHREFNYSKLILNDLSDEFKRVAYGHFTQKEEAKLSFLSGDIEQVTLPEECNLIISSSTEQWIENKEVFYKKVYDSLSENSYFVFSSFAQDNLKELRVATGISLKYYSLEESKKMLQNYFEIVQVEEEKISLEFSSALEILRHIKKTGVNAISRQDWTTNSVNNLLRKIENVCKKGDAFRITYHPTYFILKKKQ